MELLVLHRDAAYRAALAAALDGRPVGAYRATAREVAGWDGLRAALEETGVASGALVDPHFGLPPNASDGVHAELEGVARDFPTSVFLALTTVSARSVAQVVELERRGMSGVIAMDHNDTPAAITRLLNRGLLGRYRATLFELGLHAVPGHGAAILGAAGTATVVKGGVDVMARELGVSVPTLARWCRDAGLPPPGRLLAWGRVLMAATLLDNSGRSVSGVASAVGYAAESGLRRVFDRFLGESPAELRRRGAFDVAKARFVASLSEERGEGSATPAVEDAVDPGDLRRLPPSAILSVGPPSPSVLIEEAPEETAYPGWLVLTDLQLAGVRVLVPDDLQLRKGRALGSGTLGDAALVEPLRTLDGLLSDPAGLQDAAAAGDALSRVVRILEERGWERSALAAVATWLWIQPESVRANLEASRVLRERGRPDEAETLGARAVIIARQKGDWPAYCDAGVRLAAIHREQGDPDAAGRMLERVRSRAARHGLKRSLAEATRRRSEVAAEAGDVETTGSLVREALALSGSDRPAERLTLAARGCRAAAEVGDREAFERYWAEAWGSSYEELAGAVIGAALVELARAAGKMGAPVRAQLSANRALRNARELGDEALAADAEEILGPARA